jgi:ech hydrogenase subunit F
MANPLNLPMVGRSLRNLVSRPATRRYPYEVRPRYIGARGTLEFDVETCNYCMLCARRCPAAALTVSREERTWAIEQLTCIAFGVCVDVCAKKSLTMSAESRHVHTRAEVGPQGQRPGHEQWHGADPAAAPGAGEVAVAAPAARSDPPGTAAGPAS